MSGGFPSGTTTELGFFLSDLRAQWHDGYRPAANALVRTHRSLSEYTSSLTVQVQDA